jgi:hypothetical protein
MWAPHSWVFSAPLLETPIYGLIPRSACRAVHQQPNQFGLVGSSGQEGKSGHTELTPTEVVITHPVEIDRRIIEDYGMLLRLPTVQLSMLSMNR